MSAPFDPRSVGPRIRMMLPDMSPLESKIMEFLLRTEFDDAIPLKEVADAASVSEAMVVKTAKKLGFEGFRELRSALIEYKRLPLVDLHKEVTPEDTAEIIVQKVFRTSIQALEETLAILDIEAFKYAADLIHRSKQRDFYGLGGSAQIARDAAHKFLRIGIRASVFDDSHMMAMSANLLGPGDLAVAFSHSGRSASLVDAVQFAKRNGASVIGISNYDTGPIAKLADVMLCSTAQGSPLIGENAAARIAQLNIIDAIFVAVAQKDYSLAEKHLSQTMAAVQTNRN